MFPRPSLRRCLVLESFILSLGVLAASHASATAQEQKPNFNEVIDKLVEQLDDDDFKMREEATAELIDLGPDAQARLKAMIDEPNRQLSAEQRSRMESIIASGPVLRLERTSGFDSSTIELLRQFRQATIDQNSRWEATRNVESLMENAQTTDAGIALIVKTVASTFPKTPPAENAQREEPLIDSHRAFRILESALDHVNADADTHEELARWTISWYVPRYREKGKTENSSMHDHEFRSAESVVRRMLTADVFEADQFDTLLDAFCVQQVASGNQDSYSEFGSRPDVMIGFSFSKHTTSRHVGKLAGALLDRATHGNHRSHSRSAYESLRYVTSSPHLTPAHARAIVETLLAQEFDNHQVDELLTWVTGGSIWKPEDMHAPIDELMAISRGAGMRERWKEYWNAHRDDPLLTARDNEPIYRYILIEMDASDTNNIEIHVVADMKTGPGRSATARSVRQPGGLYWFMIQNGKARSWQQAVEYNFQMHEDAVLIASAHFQGGGYGGSSGAPFVPGRVRTKGSTTYSNGNKRVRLHTFEYLQRLSDGPGPDEAQLHDVRYWISRIVESAVANQLDIEELAKTNKLILGYGRSRSDSISHMNGYRCPDLEREVTALLDHEHPAVVAYAAELLAEWEIPFETKRIYPLLNAEQGHVRLTTARTIGLTGDIHVARWAIEKMTHDEGTAGLLGILTEMSEFKKIKDQDRLELAAEIIKRLLPKTETVDDPAFDRFLLVKQWCGWDFGYELGAGVGHNNPVLARYHEWAENPTPLPDADEPNESSEAAAGE